jgi:hypothetical protein
MTIVKSIISAAALSSIALAGHAGASPAIDANGVRTFKPLHAIVFDAGHKRGVGYFSNDAGNCKLVITLADESKGDPSQSFTASRYEAAVSPGQFTRYASDDHAFEFGCAGRAEAMSFKPLSTVASAQSE